MPKNIGLETFFFKKNLYKRKKKCLGTIFFFLNVINFLYYFKTFFKIIYYQIL